MDSCLHSNAYRNNGCKPYGLSLLMSVQLPIPDKLFHMEHGHSADTASAGATRLHLRNRSLLLSLFPFLWSTCLRLFPMYSNDQYVTSASRDDGALHHVLPQVHCSPRYRP